MARFNKASITAHYRQTSIIVLGLLVSMLSMAQDSTQELKKAIEQNQEVIRRQINQLNKVVSKPKVVYVRISEELPKKNSRGYIKVERAKLQFLGIDTLKLQLLVIDSVPAVPSKIIKKIKKHSFWYWLVNW